MNDPIRSPRKKQKDYESSKHGVLCHWEALARRDGGLYCRYCGIALIDPYLGELRSYPTEGKAPCSVDHAIPWTRGGSDELDNLVLACVSCNSSKGAKTPEEFKLWKERKGHV